LAFLRICQSTKNDVQVKANEKKEPTVLSRSRDKQPGHLKSKRLIQIKEICREVKKGDHVQTLAMRNASEIQFVKKPKINNTYKRSVAAT
jgi:hypothetical protein